MTTTKKNAPIDLLRGILRSFRASPVFAFYVLVTLVIAGVTGLMLLPPIQDFLGMSHFTEADHRTHDLAFGFLITTGIVGILTQLRRPKRNIAGMLMALIPFAGLLVAALLSGEFQTVMVFNPSYLVASVTVITALVHPSGREFFTSFRLSRINWTMLALVGIAAVPLLSLASTNIRLQATVLDDHAGMGHYGFMAALALTVIGVGLMASLRPDGWRLTAWAGGLLPTLFGITSLVYPDAASSLGLIWALAAIVWGAVFVAVAELTKRTDKAMGPGSERAVSRSAPD
jgi:hypothetical protein